MQVSIGAKYEETKARLCKMIINGTGNMLESTATNHACYFCRNPIEGRMRVLTLNEPYMIQGFSLVKIVIKARYYSRITSTQCR